MNFGLNLPKYSSFLKLNNLIFKLLLNRLILHSSGQLHFCYVDVFLQGASSSSLGAEVGFTGSTSSCSCVCTYAIEVPLVLVTLTM